MQKFPRNALFLATLLACSPLVHAEDAAKPAEAAKPAGPTIGDLLTNSGVELKGYIDVAAEGTDLKSSPSTQGAPSGNPYKVFDASHSGLVLHQGSVTIDKLPKEGFGGLATLTVGHDANIIKSYGTSSSANYFDVTQLFAQYAHGPLTLQLGKFNTLAGAEVIDSSANTNFSRSILFGQIPFTHTGVRATYAVDDTTNLIAGINNGWDQLSDFNTQKTVELGLTSNPVKPLNIAASIYSGVEPVSAPGPTPAGNRSLFDLVLSYAVSDKLTLILNGDYAVQENATLADGTTGDAKWYGVAVYANYQIDDNNRLSLRGEEFTDENGYTKSYVYGEPAAKHEANEFTLTYGYSPAKNFELRTEFRYDTGTTADFLKPESTQLVPVTTKNGSSFALQGVYKF